MALGALAFVTLCTVTRIPAPCRGGRWRPERCEPRKAGSARTGPRVRTPRGLSPEHAAPPRFRLCHLGAGKTKQEQKETQDWCSEFDEGTEGTLRRSESVGSGHLSPSWRGPGTAVKPALIPASRRGVGREGGASWQPLRGKALKPAGLAANWELTPRSVLRA